MTRIILLLDFDYFYAQIEERDNSKYKDKPLVVCVYSGRTENSGAVATCNYKARDLGIRSGMPISFAQKHAEKDSETVFIPVRMDYYKEVSSEIMEMLRSHADKFEQVSVDEAYLDISESSGENYQKAAVIAANIKKEVKEKFELTCSIGIGPNKLLAKMSAGVHKPDGLTIIKPEDVREFMDPLLVHKLFGIGPKTTKILAANNVTTIRDLAMYDIGVLQRLFGENKGVLLHNRALGIDEEIVEDSDKQQISRLTTLKEDTMNMDILEKTVEDLARSVYTKTDNMEIQFKTVSIIAINSELQTRTRSKTLDEPSDDLDSIQNSCKELIKDFLKDHPEKLRRIGVRISNFSDYEKEKKQSDLGKFFKK
ncbi:MAG: DNA polymerase IV [Candidatus Aenigmatarchaeota archaeon]